MKYYFAYSFKKLRTLKSAEHFLIVQSYIFFYDTNFTVELRIW